MSQPQQPSEVSRESLISAIDFEIEKIRQDAKQPGWTEWAIYGGFAVVFWSLVTFSYSDTISVVSIAQILLSFSFIYQSLGLFRTIYASGTSEFLGWLTFHRHAFSSSPRMLFATTVLQILLFATALVGAPGVWWMHILVVLVWIVLTLILQAWLFWQWFEDFPIIKTKPNQSRKWLNLAITFAVYTIIMAVMLWGASGYFFAVILGGSDSITLVEEFKLAGLLFAALFLFEKLFYEPAPRRVLEDLSNLRRALILNEIDTTKCVYELKKILGMLNPTEFIDGLKAQYLSSLEIVSFLAERIEQHVAYFGNDSASAVDSGSPEDDELTKRVKAFVDDERSLLLFADGLDGDKAAFDRQLKWVKFLLPVEVDEITAAEQSLSDLRQKVDEKVGIAKSAMIAFRGDSTSST